MLEADASAAQHEAVAADAHATRQAWYSTMWHGAKGVASAATSTAPGAPEQSDPNAQATLDYSVPQAAAGVEKGLVTSGVGGEYARSMLGPSNDYTESHPFYKYGREVAQQAWGAAEWAGWGEAGKVARALPEIGRVPAMLQNVLKEALVTGGISAGAEAATAKMQGRKANIPQAGAMGAILGAIGGAFTDPKDLANIHDNWNDLMSAAGSDAQRGFRDLHAVATSIAKSERTNAQDAMKTLSRFASAPLADRDEAVAAKVRLMAASNPNLFKTSLMKRVLRAAEGGTKEPAIAIPRAGEMANWWETEPEATVVKQEGAPGSGRVGPMGVPLDEKGNVVEPPKREPPSKVRAAKVAAKPPTINMHDELSKAAAWKTGDPVTKEVVARRKNIVHAAMTGNLRPEHVDIPDHANVVARSVARSYREYERAVVGGDASAVSHPYTMEQYANRLGDWQRRARELKAVALPEDGDVTSAADTKMMDDAVNGKGPKKSPTPRDPAPRKMTKAIQKVKRDKMGRFC